MNWCRRIQSDAFLGIRPEASSLNINPIRAGNQLEFESAGLVGFGRLRFERASLLNAHQSARNERSARIGNGTGKLLQITGENGPRSERQNCHGGQDTKQKERRPEVTHHEAALLTLL